MRSNVLSFSTSAIDPVAVQSTLSPQAWELINHTGSLTQRFREITNQSIIFRLLFANWGHANQVERHTLKLPALERTWLREIEWWHNNQRWVSARVIVPETTMSATGGIFSSLGVQSLGEIIFQDTNLVREPFVFSQLKDDIWARKSIFRFKNSPFLITEIFFPEAYALLPD